MHVAGLERRGAHQQGVDDDADGPHVNLVRVPATLGAGENLGGDVVGSAANRRLALVGALDAAREAEIANLEPPARGDAVIECGIRARAPAGATVDVARCSAAASLLVPAGGGIFATSAAPGGFVEARGGEEQVTELEVPVYDPVRVEVRDGRDDLARVRRALGLGEPPSGLDHVRERAVAAELHEDVHVCGILEASDESDDVRVVASAVDANLGEDLRPRAFLLERALRDHLRREVFPRGGILHAVHHRESALAERPAANVRARLGLAGARALVALGDDARALHLLRSIAALVGSGRGTSGAR